MMRAAGEACATGLVLMMLVVVLSTLDMSNEDGHPRRSLAHHEHLRHHPLPRKPTAPVAPRASVSRWPFAASVGRWPPSTTSTRSQSRPPRVQPRASKKSKPPSAVAAARAAEYSASAKRKGKDEAESRRKQEGIESAETRRMESLKARRRERVRGFVTESGPGLSVKGAEVRSSHHCTGSCCEPLHRDRTCVWTNLLFVPPSTFYYLTDEMQVTKPHSGRRQCVVSGRGRG